LEPRVELKPVPHALALPGLYTQQNTNADDLINLIGGYTGNSVTPDAWSATISGGGSAGLPNRVTDHYGTVGGGSNNQAGDNAGPTDDRRFATVGGGASNRASGEYSTVGGGIANIGSGHYATVGGGIGNTASEESSTVAGGVLNTASNLQSTVGGGLSNTASGQLSVVPGGWQNVAGGYYSFAAGRRAKVRDPAASLDSDGDAGTFMWADSTDADFISTGPDRFLVRASNGSAIYSSAALTAGVSLAAGGGSWSSVSDRNLKENIRQVDAREVLERLRTVPVTTWNYKSQNASIRHIGPMGQDFYSAFGVGEEDTKIATADVDGVALAAIQGLHQLVQEKDCEIGVLENEIESLKSQISNLKELEARLARLEARSGNH
jgi:hypothetical protein